MLRKLDPKNDKQYTHNMHRAKDWFKQAKDDLLWAKSTLQAKHFAQACFAAQQVSEKALKVFVLVRGYDSVRSHSLLTIVKELGMNGEIALMAKKLDQYYVSTRYPDAFYEGAPYEYFTEEQAVEAITFAEKYISLASQELENVAKQ